MTEQTANRAAGQAQEGGQQWLGMLQALAEQIQRQQQNSQQMIQELMNTYMQMFNIPFSYAQEGLQMAQRATAEVPIEGYDEMNVSEVAQQLGTLSADELQRVRDYEMRNKNRETLLGQIDQRINAAS